MLRDLAQAPRGGTAEVAGVFVQTPLKQGEKRGFTRTIAANQGYFFTWLYAQIAIGEENFTATTQRYMV